MTRRKSSISVFSIGPISINIDPEDLETPFKNCKTENNGAPPPHAQVHHPMPPPVVPSDLNAGHVGGWANPNPHMTRPELISLNHAPVDVHCAAQPHVPGPALYHMPNIPTENGFFE